MHPLASSEARTFWERALQATADGQRIVFGAFEDDQLVATVSLLLDCPPNQPHRAEIAKMMTLPRCRGRGIAASLLQAAEAAAVASGKTLLVLDTASEGGAAGLYAKHGFTLSGEIPDYALKPLGGLTGTLLYWKRIGTHS
ncbi:GNAT family N-acetyltransferase [Massilia scottii]|uniref:GNAT family N-acetyltransferase n=1 Tax=Massilia scottii TaxID=3057166 RepID=UPI00279642A8|nr:GNAT family N-acetyltransferase [Massilia sp. CCM 9029]MDQ1833572.1 GNAT family N-acetyltransferase [Massilia sp. CCM 9029]